MKPRHQHETFAQGAKPGDKPIKRVSEAVPEEFLAHEHALNLLKAYRKGDIPDARTDELFNALMVTLEIFPDTEAEPKRGVMQLIRESLNMKFMRRGNDG